MFTRGLRASLFVWYPTSRKPVESTSIGLLFPIHGVIEGCSAIFSRTLAPRSHLMVNYTRSYRYCLLIEATLMLIVQFRLDMIRCSRLDTMLLS